MFFLDIEKNKNVGVIFGYFPKSLKKTLGGPPPFVTCFEGTAKLKESPPFTTVFSNQIYRHGGGHHFAVPVGVIIIIDVSV